MKNLKEKYQSQEEFSDMESLIKWYGESCLEDPLADKYDESRSAISHTYKGLNVIRNIDKLNGTKYYTIVNDSNNTHIHVMSKNIAHRICDCYIDFISERDITKYCIFYRKGALGLAGYNIRPNKNNEA